MLSKIGVNLLPKTNNNNSNTQKNFMTSMSFTNDSFQKHKISDSVSFSGHGKTIKQLRRELDSFGFIWSKSDSVATLKRKLAQAKEPIPISETEEDNPFKETDEIPSWVLF